MNKFSLILFLTLLLFCSSGCEKEKPLSIGDKAPLFTLEDLNGQKISLDKFLKNKEIILNFWASWCPECQREIPLLNEFSKKYKDKIEIIGINLKESKTLVKSFSQERNIEYKVLLDTNGKTARLYRIFGVPINILINKEGLIKNLNLDIREMESYLK